MKQVSYKVVDANISVGKLEWLFSLICQTCTPLQYAFWFKQNQQGTHHLSLYILVSPYPGTISSKIYNYQLIGSWCDSQSKSTNQKWGPWVGIETCTILGIPEYHNHPVSSKNLELITRINKLFQHISGMVVAILASLHASYILSFHRFCDIQKKVN